MAATIDSRDRGRHLFLERIEEHLAVGSDYAGALKRRFLNIWR